ncbi:MAG: VTT domain-containing protein [Planctomycetota bacterium]|nr:VTT domain-containing protein [Planctomycetota bacterium]
MKKKLLTLVIVVALIGVGWYLVQRYFGLETIAAQEARLRAVLTERPVAAFLIGLLVYVGLSFIPPTAGKSLIFGWLFGVWQGVLLINVGLTIAAIGMFLISRYLLRDGLRSRFTGYVARLDRVMESDGSHYLFALRMMHAPYTILNYAMGATTLKTRSFWWATQVGMLPGNILFAYAGARLPTLTEAADKGVTSIASPQLLLALVALGLFPLLVRWFVRRRRLRVQ